MSSVMYVSFPKEPRFFSLVDVIGQDNLDGKYGASIVDKENVTFTDCLKNPCIYQFYVGLCSDDYDNYYDDEYWDMIEGKLDHNETKKMLKKRDNTHKRLHQQALHDFLYANLDVGEFAEIYFGWTNHVHDDFGPPETESTIDLFSLLDTPLPFRMRTNYSHRLTVCKTTDERQDYKLQGSTPQDYDDNEMYYKRRLADLQVKGDEQGVAIVCMELGTITEYYSDDSAAESWLKQALDIWIKLKEYTNASKVCHMMALLAITKSINKRCGMEIDAEIDSFAVHWFEQTLEYALRADDDRLVADAYAGLANRALLRKDFVSAEHFNMQALPFGVKLHGEGAKCNIFLYMGKVAEMYGHYDSAIKYYKQTLSAFENMGDDYSHTIEYVQRLLHDLTAKHKETDCN